MRKPILIAAMIAAFAAPAFADELTLKDVRAMSDNELYALAETLSGEDEARLYQKARKEFPEGALGLQSTIDKLEKARIELDACRKSLADGEASQVRALNKLEPAMYFNLLRIVAVPTDETLDLTKKERETEAKKAGRETNGIIRDFRECKREYRKRFGED